MKDIIKPVAVLAAICLVITAALAGVNMLTIEPIAKNEAAAAQSTMEELIPNSNFELVEKSELQCESAYVAIQSDKTVGYVFTSSAFGYGGQVKVMTAIDGEGAVIGVRVLACDDETPGLGQNVKKAEFTDKFVSLKSTDEVNAVDGVTSATFSSKAVKKSINNALADFELITAKGGSEK